MDHLHGSSRLSFMLGICRKLTYQGSEKRALMVVQLNAIWCKPHSSELERKVHRMHAASVEPSRMCAWPGRAGSTFGPSAHGAVVRVAVQQGISYCCKLCNSLLYFPGYKHFWLTVVSMQARWEQS